MPSRAASALVVSTLVLLATARGEETKTPTEPPPPAPVARMGGAARPTGVSRLAFAPDGKSVAWAGSGPVRLYEPVSGKLLRSLKVGDGVPRCLAFSPDGKTLAAGEGSVVHLFDDATGKEITQFKAHENGVLAVAFAPDGTTLATGGDDDHVGLWDPAAGKERSRLDLHEKGASVLAFSPDGKFLTAGGEAGELTVWRMEDEDERRRLRGRAGAVGFAAFLPGGRSFVWTQGDTIRVSETETWVELSRYDGGDMAAVCYALSPDGRTLATGGGKAVRLWDLETGEELLRLADDKTEAAAVTFAPDGKTLASAGADGAVLVWDLKRLADARLEALWRELGGSSAADAVHAVRAMKATPAATVAFLHERLKPTPPPDVRAARLIADLDSDDYAVREKATAELAKRGRSVYLDLQKAYAHDPAPEARWRLEALLTRLKDAPSEDTAKERAVEVLETIGTDEARAVLEGLAKGRPDARITTEAKASLQRLSGRPSP